MLSSELQYDDDDDDHDGPNWSSLAAHWRWWEDQQKL